MLHFVIGPAGSGKSYQLLGKAIADAEENRKRNVFFVVPEQFTLHVQREVIERSPRHGMMNMDVLSFPRLAHRVFEELGITPPMTLEDSGKTMIVKKVVLDKASELGVFAGKIHKQGFIEQMKSVIAEFYQYSISPDELEEMMAMKGLRTQLKSKLKDIDIIYRGFRDFIRDRFIMKEELLELFAEKILRSEDLKGSSVIFDGFTGFTVMQLRCMEQLLHTASEVYVSITAEPESIYGLEKAGKKDAKGQNGIFDLSRMTVKRLEKIAIEAGQEVYYEESGSQTASYRFKDSPALAALEQGIFRRPLKTSDDCKGITLVSCESPAAEVRFVIGSIRRLAMEEGYRYSDIAVITGGLETYEEIAVREFSSAGIDFFIDSKKSIIGTEPVELLRSVILTALRGFDATGIFRFVKSSLSGFDRETAAQMENYCLARGTRGEGFWKKEWKNKYTTRYALDLEMLNLERQKVYTTLIEPALQLTGEHTAGERISVLRDVLEKLDIENKLKSQEETGRVSSDAGERLDALEAGQLYQKIGEVFERIDKLLGDDMMSLKEFSEILDTGFTEAKLAVIPQENDHVLIGDMERTRLGAVKVLFFIGANDGMVPKPAGEQGLLSYADRVFFEDHEIELSPVGLRSSYLQEFYLYLNMTKPSEKLYMSYHRMTADKKPGHRSLIFAELQKIFPKLSVRDIYRDDREMLLGSDCGRRAAAALLRDKEMSDLDSVQLTILSTIASGSAEEYAMMLKAAFEYRKNASITKKSAKDLYGSVLTGSVSRLENFAACAYSHFLKYGLKLEERPEFKVGAVELGNIYHKAVEEYGRRLKKRGIRWHDTTEAVRDEVLQEAIDAALNEYADVIGSSSRNAYIKIRTGRVLKRTVEILDHQVRGGSFEPEYFEQGFEAAGEFMKLVGKIDRVDVAYDKNNRPYIRIVDYKSGKKKFDPALLYNGLQIQLAVYMNEAAALFEPSQSPEAAGMYYYNIDDPMIDEIENPSEAESKRISDLKLEGPTGNDKICLGLSDAGLVDAGGNANPGYSSDIISAKYKKDGMELTKNSNVLSSERLKAAGEYASLLMERGSQRICEGDISINPYSEKILNACSYCPYGNVCGFEYRMGYRFRNIKKQAKDELWEKIENKDTVFST
ncbi:MAG: PD-(D/E)XK nuclease family protein [Lachnospiraceae bacterium]|nr:PD-(D/E)XK nuclease family protein [Lachnospiraceae bacterium]